MAYNDSYASPFAADQDQIPFKVIKVLIIWKEIFVFIWIHLIETMVVVANAHVINCIFLCVVAAAAVSSVECS